MSDLYQKINGRIFVSCLNVVFFIFAARRFIVNLKDNYLGNNRLVLVTCEVRY